MNEPYKPYIGGIPAKIAKAIAWGIVTIPTVIPARKSSIKEYLLGKLKIFFSIHTSYKLTLNWLNFGQ